MQEDIKKTFETLQNGGTILYPTDTIWGLGCDATNAAAVKKIFAIKKRSENVSFIVLVDSVAMLERYVTEMPDVAYDLIDLSEKPITVIFEKARNLPDDVIGEDGSVGIRVTNDPFTKQLIQKFRRPIVSTSANLHGEPTPSFYKEVSKEMREAVDYVVLHRQTETLKRQASSIIKIKNNGQITIIRE